MGNLYDSQSISNYNSNPPADDGSEVASNQVNWSKHKTKLADPVKTLAEGINSEANDTFGKLPYYATRSVSSADSLVAADDHKIISCTNSFTFTLLAAATAGTAFRVMIYNAGTGTITIDGDGSETINGATTVLLQKQYDSVELWCGGSNWLILTDSRTSYETAINEAKGADIASASTTDIGAATGNYVDVTGTTTITAFGTVQAGTEREVQFDDAVTLTHNGTSLILPGATNITTAAGDVARFRSLGSGNWKLVSYQFAASLSGARSLETEQATTSGTTIDFTGLPNGAQIIEILFDGVSVSSANDICIRIGDSGGFETSGYVASASGGASITNSTTLFPVTTAIVAGNAFYGSIVLALEDDSDNTWTLSGQLTDGTGTNPIKNSAGRKALSDKIDRVQLLINGAGNFDAGAVNVAVHV